MPAALVFSPVDGIGVLLEHLLELWAIGALL